MAHEIVDKSGDRMAAPGREHSADGRIRRSVAKDCVGLSLRRPRPCAGGGQGHVLVEATNAMPGVGELNAGEGARERRGALMRCPRLQPKHLAPGTEHPGTILAAIGWRRRVEDEAVGSRNAR